jgi:hypothetical protein
MSDQATINYAGRFTRVVVPTRLFWWAIAFSVFPLVGGLAIFVAWLITRAEFLPVTGFVWMGIGVLFVICSAVCALVYLIQEWTRGTRSIQNRVLRLALVFVLIVSNFAAAFLIGDAVMTVQIRDAKAHGAPVRD